MIYILRQINVNNNNNNNKKKNKNKKKKKKKNTEFMYKENRLLRRHILSLHTVDRGSRKDKNCTYFL